MRDWQQGFVWMGASVLTLGLTGCEALIPLALGTPGPNNEGVANATPLLVELHSVSGQIDGEPIDMDMVHATGDFNGVGLFFAFDLALEGGPKSLELLMENAEASGANPYGGGGDCERIDFDEPRDEEVGDSPNGEREIEAEVADEGQVRGSPVTLSACDFECVEVEDLEVEVVEGPESRTLTLDGVWEGNEVHLHLDYVRPE